MIAKTKKEIYEYYHARSVAYGIVFDDKSPFTKTVLEDLAEFCRASESCFHSDPRIHAVLEGRRETWLRVKEFLTLNAEQLIEKHIKTPQTNRGESP
jgi:hypothetical protein